MTPITSLREEAEEPKLKPCPFCGDLGAEVNQSSIPNTDGGYKRGVYCNTCFCEGPPAATDEAACVRWNTRSPSHPEYRSSGEKPGFPVGGPCPDCPAAAGVKEDQRG